MNIRQKQKQQKRCMRQIDDDTLNAVRRYADAFGISQEDVAQMLYNKADEQEKKMGEPAQLAYFTDERIADRGRTNQSLM